MVLPAPGAALIKKRESLRVVTNQSIALARQFVATVNPGISVPPF